MDRQIVRLFVILSYLSPYSAVGSGDLAEALAVGEDLLEYDFGILEDGKVGLIREDGRYRLSSAGYQRLLPFARRSLRTMSGESPTVV